MNWERLAGLRVPVLMLLSVLTLVGGVGTGVFLISVAAGWITVGVLGCMALAFLAYVVDPDAATGTAAGIARVPDRMMVR